MFFTDSTSYSIQLFTDVIIGITIILFWYWSWLQICYKTAHLAFESMSRDFFSSNVSLSGSFWILVWKSNHVQVNVTHLTWSPGCNTFSNYRMFDIAFWSRNLLYSTLDNHSSSTVFTHDWGRTRVITPLFKANFNMYS